MPAWKYLKASFWHRVPLPLLGRVPLNAAALAGFGIAGFDQPLLWAAGAVWGTLWMTGTAGRASYRRKVDSEEKRQAWRMIEERRLQLYNRLPEPERLRHYRLRATAGQVLRSPETAAGQVDPAVELFTWLHLKLLLAREQALRARGGSGAVGADGTAAFRVDPDAPRLQAHAAVEFTDPANARLADESIGLIAPALGLHDPAEEPVAAIGAALARIEGELSRMSGLPPAPGAAAGIPPVPGVPGLIRLAEAEAARLPVYGALTPGPEAAGLDAAIHRLAE